jgi:hypothetical protein
VTLRLVVADSPAEQDAARAVEAQVFQQAFGNTPEVMAQEYGPFAGRSRYIAVLDDANGTALGAARLILPDDAGSLKTLDDVAGPPWQLSVDDVLGASGLAGRLVWDVASLAVDRRYRSGAAGAEVVLALCHGIYRFTLSNGVDGLVTVLDDRVLRLLRLMGAPCAPMPGAASRAYMGSPASTPCVWRVDAMATGVLDRRPDLAPAMVEGRFSSISCDPADLLPGRGVPGADRSAPTRPAAVRVPLRDTSGWRRPGLRRQDETVGRPAS